MEDNINASNKEFANKDQNKVTLKFSSHTLLGNDKLFLSQGFDFALPTNRMEY